MGHASQREEEGLRMALRAHTLQLTWVLILVPSFSMACARWSASLVDGMRGVRLLPGSCCCC